MTVASLHILHNPFPFSLARDGIANKFQQNFKKPLTNRSLYDIIGERFE